MRLRPKDYEFRQGIQAVVTPAPALVCALGLWFLTPVVSCSPLRRLLTWAVGEHHCKEIPEAEDRAVVEA